MAAAFCVSDVLSVCRFFNAHKNQPENQVVGSNLANHASATDAKAVFRTIQAEG
jgi:hypothetical protein